MEAGEMQWGDIDEGWDIWTLQPIDQMTGHRAGIIVGKEFEVPISQPMKDILEQMKIVRLELAQRERRALSPEDFVFPTPMKTKRGQAITKDYSLIAAGRLKAVKSGRSTLVFYDSVKQYIAGLPPAQIKFDTRAKRHLEAVAAA
jgi:hypothetical protein